MNSVLGAVTTGPGRVIFMLVGIVLLCVCLYYLYKYINGDAEKADMVVFANSTGGLPGNSASPTVFTSKNMPAIYGGGEYSVSLWIYIAKWSVNAGKNKTFLTIDSASGAFNTLQMYLGKDVNKVGIRVSTQPSTHNKPDGTPSVSDTLNAATKTLIDNGTTPYDDGEQNFAQGDIKSIDLQKWVHLCVVLSGRRLDVYMDGKLNRSTVLDGMYAIGGTGTDYRMTVGGYSPSSTVTRPGFGGLIGQINAANFAYTPDRVWALYNNGPVDTSIWTLIKSYFDPGQYSFALKRNGENVIAGSTPDL